MMHLGSVPIGLFFTVVMVLTKSATADQQIVRGPYLQRVSASEITVCWRSAQIHTGAVFYGAAMGGLTNRVTEGTAGTEHAVILTGLEGNSEYYYQINDGTNVLAGGTNHFFQTAPQTGAAVPGRIWVLGDSGTANSNAKAVYDSYRAYTGGQYTDLMLMLGDNAYYTGTDDEYQRAVFEMYPEILRQTPWFSCLGNHDGYSADSASQTGPYFEIFTLPTAGECGGVASGTEAYYSFDFGNIHFISLDSFDSPRGTDGLMYSWLLQDLAANTSDWLVAFWHHPPHSKGSHDSDDEVELMDMRRNFMPLLENAGVDLVLSGHSHSYERSCLIHNHYGPSLTFDLQYHAVNAGNGNEQEDGTYEKALSGAYAGKGTIYMVAGSSGLVSGTQPDYPHPAMTSNFLELGSTVIDVSGLRMNVVFLNSAGVVRDSFSLIKVEVVPGDMDGDGLPNDWEQYYFQNPTNAVAGSDADADGLDNLSEYIAGTEPKNAASLFSLETSRQPNGTIQVRWPAQVGRIYDLWQTDNLASNNWLMVERNLPPTSPLNKYIDSTSSNSAFYRVDVRLP